MKCKLSISLFMVWFLSGCVNNPSFQPLDNNSPQKISKSSEAPKNPHFHTVNKGETLYSIALQYDLDYKLLASNNNVDKNFNIVPGQRLKLSVMKQHAKTSVSAPKKQKISTSDNSSSKKSSSVKKPLNSPTIKLNWPVDKTIVRTGGAIVRQLKGIDIRSQIGDSVLAAADGEVVFAGSGLRGYGNLIIIQHTDDILTAYAYTNEIFVKEKQVVKTGDRIATVGTNGSVEDSALHFEVRKNGKPLDPLTYLPK